MTFLGFVLFFTSLSTSLSAAENQTQVSSTSVSDKTSLMDQLYVNFFSNFHGTPIKDPTIAYTPNIKGYNSNSNGIYFDSTLVTAYMIDKDIGIGPELNFWMTPVLGRGFDLQDSGVRVFNNHLIKTSQLNVSGNFIVQAPVSDFSKARGQDLGLKTTPSIRYRFKNSSFILGAFTEAKAYLGVESGKTFKLWAEPFVNYELDDNIILTLGYEMEARHMRNASTFDFVNDHTDLQPGVRFQISKKIFVNPYINLYTGEKITSENTYLGAIVSASL